MRNVLVSIQYFICLVIVSVQIYLWMQRVVEWQLTRLCMYEWVCECPAGLDQWEGARDVTSRAARHWLADGLRAWHCEGSSHWVQLYTQLFLVFCIEIRSHTENCAACAYRNVNKCASRNYWGPWLQNCALESKYKCFPAPLVSPFVPLSARPAKLHRLCRYGSVINLNAINSLMLYFNSILHEVILWYNFQYVDESERWIIESDWRNLRDTV